jgi:hypothetical protein
LGQAFGHFAAQHAGGANHDCNLAAQIKSIHHGANDAEAGAEFKV